MLPARSAFAGGNREALRRCLRRSVARLAGSAAARPPRRRRRCAVASGPGLLAPLCSLASLGGCCAAALLAALRLLAAFRRRRRVPHPPPVYGGAAAPPLRLDWARACGSLRGGPRLAPEAAGGARGFAPSGAQARRSACAGTPTATTPQARAAPAPGRTRRVAAPGAAPSLTLRPAGRDRMEPSPATRCCYESTAAAGSGQGRQAPRGRRPQRVCRPLRTSNRTRLDHPIASPGTRLLARPRARSPPRPTPQPASHKMCYVTSGGIPPTPAPPPELAGPDADCRPPGPRIKTHVAVTCTPPPDLSGLCASPAKFSTSSPARHRPRTARIRNTDA